MDALAEAAESQRFEIHHSYIWLGSIRSAVVIWLAVLASLGSSATGLRQLVEALGLKGAALTLAIIGAVVASLILVFAISLVYRILAYKRIICELTPTELSLRSGIVFKKHVHVPYQRIQSVDQRASLLQRLVGVCSVYLDTAGGSSNKAVIVPYVKKTAAEELRLELFARKYYLINGGDPAQLTAVRQAQRAAQSAEQQRLQAAEPQKSVLDEANDLIDSAFTPTSNILDPVAALVDRAEADLYSPELYLGKVTYEYGLSNKELAFAGLSNGTAFGVAILLVIATVASTVDFVSGLMFADDAAIANAFMSWLSGWSTTRVVLVATGALLASSAVVWALSALSSCIRLGGFKARRRETRVEVEYGLIQRRVQGVDIDKVQSVIIKQNFIRRLIGYGHLSLGKIEAAATEDASTKGNNGVDGGKMVIHPFVKMDRVPEILEGLVPEFSGEVTELQSGFRPVAPCARKREMKRRTVIYSFGFYLIIVLAIAQIICNACMGDATDAFVVAALTLVNHWMIVGYAIGIVCIAVGAKGAQLWYRNSGFAFTKTHMLVQNGGWSMEQTIMPRAKIQNAMLRTNPFQRNAKVASLKVRTAAGIGGTTVTLLDADERDARAWLDWARPGGTAGWAGGCPSACCAAATVGEAVLSQGETAVEDEER